MLHWLHFKHLQAQIASGTAPGPPLGALSNVRKRDKTRAQNRTPKKPRVTLFRSAFEAKMGTISGSNFRTSGALGALGGVGCGQNVILRGSQNRTQNRTPKGAPNGALLTSILSSFSGPVRKGVVIVKYARRLRRSYDFKGRGVAKDIIF